MVAWAGWGTLIVVGVGLGTIAGLTVFGPGIAIAGRSGGGESAISFITGQSGGHNSGSQTLAPVHGSYRSRDLARSAQSLSSRAVCVRLCDGSFFPLDGIGQGNQAGCASQCPGAPTQVFFLTTGSDQIDDAIASNGQQYAALPVAFRYRSTVDSTCTCAANGAHKGVVALLQDPTLRKGDMIMTDAGIRVFRGGRGMPYGMTDFAGLAQSSLPRDERETLMAMERANARSPGAARHSDRGPSDPAVVVSDSASRPSVPK